MTVANEMMTVTKTSPPVAVATGNLVGVPLPDVVQWVTLIYLALLIAHKAWRWHRELTQKEGRDESDE
jgi:hypothetical protein